MVRVLFSLFKLINMKTSSVLLNPPTHTHQSCGGFSVDALQVDLLVLLLLPLLLLPSAAALDADAQAAQQNQQSAGRKDGVDGPARHWGGREGFRVRKQSLKDRFTNKHALYILYNRFSFL